MCVSTIRLCIADNIINNVMDEDSASALWEKLEKTLSCQEFDQQVASEATIISAKDGGRRESHGAHERVQWSSFEDGESAALAVQSGNRGKKSDGRSGWNNGSSSSSRGKGVQCYYCKEFGHVKRDCPLRKDKGKKCDDASSCNSLVVADDGDCLTVSEAGWTPMDASIFAGGGAMNITRGGKVLMKGEKCEGLYRLIGKTVYSTKVWKRCAQGKWVPKGVSLLRQRQSYVSKFADGCEGVKLVGREDGSRSFSRDN
ncbi:hypothetical protein Acr_17g0011980 [Actinidia rufa]|uniref:CCHC-type domain-containing protein n=1 Tax=Actinidia rufa TaxID=165716 RepID=A0A7J0G499_9ERIC|nr:hypothetical protein Acr_17g0011980 [Actinidia rufa]